MGVLRAGDGELGDGTGKGCRLFAWDDVVCPHSSCVGVCWCVWPAAVAGQAKAWGIHRVGVSCTGPTTLHSRAMGGSDCCSLAGQGAGPPLQLRGSAASSESVSQLLCGTACVYLPLGGLCGLAQGQGQVMYSAVRDAWAGSNDLGLPGQLAWLCVRSGFGGLPRAYAGYLRGCAAKPWCVGACDSRHWRNIKAGGGLVVAVRQYTTFAKQGMLIGCLQYTKTAAAAAVRGCQWRTNILCREV